MPGEAPDWGNVATVNGPPLVSLSPIGALGGFAAQIGSTQDVTGFAGVWVIVNLPTTDNFWLQLEWDATLSGSSIPVGFDTISIPKIGNLRASGAQKWVRWFPARGNQLKVFAKGNTAATYDGGIVIIPTTVTFPGKSVSAWYGAIGSVGLESGIVGFINENVNAGATLYEPFQAPWWGPISIGSSSVFTANSDIRIQSFDFRDNLIMDFAWVVSGVLTSNINAILPAAAYHKLGFTNAGGAPFNPVLTVVGDLT